MQRILVLGPPGSGKSTLARRLGGKLNIPVFHLDQAFWRPGWVAAPRSEFDAEITLISAMPAWIIDGNYMGSMGPRLAQADTVIYLDCPSWLSLARILKRTISSHGRVRRDLAKGCPERFSLEFLRYASAWNRTRRASHMAVARQFAGQSIVLSSLAEQAAFCRDARLPVKPEV